MDIKPELENPRARWITLAVTCLAGILASIQSSSLIVALVQLVTSLNATFASIIWVLLSFMLAVGATAPILGFFSDSGLKGVRCKLFNFGFTIFGIGSLLAGFAQPKFNAVDLILYRAVMGVGAGFIFSNSSPILADKFHPYGQMGLAQGLWGVGFAMGSVIGPVVGGLLLEAGWSWIFWFNVPFCAIGCTIGFWQVKDYVPKEIVGPAGEKKPQITFVQVMRKFDYLGAFLLLIAICTMFVAVVSSIFPTPTLGSTATIAFSVVCGSCAAIFLAWDIYRRDHTPFVNFRLFLNRTFTLCVIGSMCNALARGGLTFAFIFLFQGPFGATALEAGIKVIPFGIGFLLGGFPSGKLGDMYGFKIPSTIGPLVSCFGIMGAAFIHVDTNYWVIAAYLFFAGLGGGIYNSPTTALMMLSIKPTERGQSSGLSMMMSMVANAFSIVICFDLIVGSLDQALVYKLFIVGGGGLDDATLAPFLDGFHAVIWIIVAMNVCASFLSSQIKEQKRPKKGPATTTTTTPPPAGGTPLAELVKAESDPADPDAGQPEPLTAPLEGRDANPTEDEQIREKMEKELASDAAPSDNHGHHQEVELHAIKVDGADPAHSKHDAIPTSIAPVAIEIQAEPNARPNPEPAQAPSESTTISSPSEADRPKESSEIVSNSSQTNSQ